MATPAIFTPPCQVSSSHHLLTACSGEVLSHGLALVAGQCLEGGTAGFVSPGTPAAVHSWVQSWYGPIL